MDEPFYEDILKPSRYVVGIDLGTTNSAVAYVDTNEQPWRVRTFAVPQLVDAAVVEARETLPSFHYQPAAGQFSAGALRLPWAKDEPAYAVGFFARDQGALVPGRLIASAKSWLCHSGVDRTAELLPWRGAADVQRLSPVEVSARYLQHVRDAWDAEFSAERLADQDIVLTLPASFDEVARELTVQAAAQAGLPRVVLIEEPQAAFYAWIYKHHEDWEKYVEPGQKILVCDVGGGTSDFTLIRVRRSTASAASAAQTVQAAAGKRHSKQPAQQTPGGTQKIQFHRVAVGDHLILGGDNLDLALARHIERKLAGDGKLEARQWDVLVRTCRPVKETLLGDRPPERLRVNLPGSGSKLIGGGIQVEVAGEEVRQLLVDGFFPKVQLADKPIRRRSGFQEFGLPYAPDAAITRYLAAFLTAHRHVAQDEAEPAAKHDPARPDIVLFNGGVFASPVLRERLLDVLRSWFQADQQDWSPVVLDHDRLDLAVARGAAYYGMVRRGEGVRIAAGLARTYYIGVESAQPLAVCLVPGSAEAGQDIDLTDRPFDLLISEPVEFPLYVSSTRLADRPGEVLPIDHEQMTPLPPIRTVLKARRRSEAGRVSVTLHARLTEIGTLDLWCTEVGGDRSWRLQFDVRSATQTDIAAHQSASEREGFIDEATWDRCRTLIENTFGPDGFEKPEGLIKQLVASSGLDRGQWPTSLLRRIWEALMELETGRRKSAVHEARWLNLLGYALRPGYGLAVDDWRVAETWRTVQGRLVHPSPACRTESLILWRRIAGGLSAGQQRAVAEPLLAPVRSLHRRLATGKGRGADQSLSPHEMTEVWRLLGSLELLDVSLKVEMGNLAADLLPKRKLEPVRAALCWALGRIGQRVPVYGPLNTVVPVETAAAWLQTLMQLPPEEPTAMLAVMQIARRTEDRYRDLPDRLRREILDWFDQRQASPHFVELVRDGGRLDSQEQDRIFGEALPKGLRILK
jgi:molecular chaperone DnaK (HSP70)